MAYPANLDVFSVKVDGQDDILAAHVNTLQSSVVATQTELGVGLKGSAANLVARLAVALNTDGSVKAAQVLAAITAGTLTLSMLAANSVDSSKIVDASITGSDIAASTITGSNIAATTIATGNIQNLAVTAGKIAANTITASQIAAATITATELATDSISTVKIQALAVTAAKIAANTITASQIAAGTITATELATDAVSTVKIQALAVTTAKIANGAVTATQFSGILPAGNLPADVAYTDVINSYTVRQSYNLAPVASANNAIVQVGDQGFAGGGGTAFVGSALGTGVGMNFASGFGGDFFNYQLAGTSKAELTKDGRLILSDLIQVALIAAGVLPKTSAFTLGATAMLHPCDATGGAFNAQLPSAAGRTGRIYTIKKTDASANAVTVTTTGGENIDGATTFALATQYKSLTVWSDGTKWHILASF